MEAQPNNNTSYVNLNPHYRGRVRSGCLTCRSKKVKCDEQHPTCKRCFRLKRECLYPPNAVRRANDVSASFQGYTTNSRKSSTCIRLNQTSSESQIIPVFLRTGSQDIESPRLAHHNNTSPRADDSVNDLMSPFSSYSSPPSNTKNAEPQLEEYSNVSPFSPCDSSISLPSISKMTQSQAEPATDSKDLSLMTSQDIHLCTTIDWLAANERIQAVSFSYFLDEVDLPLLTPFDPFNWTHIKAYAVGIASQHKSMAAAISAVQLLWIAQTHSLPTTNAISQYRFARSMLEADLPEDVNGFSTVLLIAFLLSLFSMVLLDETDCIFAPSDGLFVDRLDHWSQTGLRTPIVSRIAAWLKIMHAAARRGGNQGIMSARVNDLLSDQYDELPSLSGLAPAHRAPAAHESVSAGIFRFHLSLQCLSLEVANLSHYHRSRTTSADQEEVVRLMGCLQADLHFLWTTRPAIMRYDPSQVHTHFPPSIAKLLVTQAAISMASYHAEHVDIGRSLGDPLALTTEAEEGLRWIQSLVDENWSIPRKLSPGLLRPLFMCAIEHENPTHSQWALDRMREIRDPISRSDFFASYAQGLAEEQKMKRRRVTTRWFCYERYGVRPPFL